MRNFCSACALSADMIWDRLNLWASNPLRRSYASYAKANAIKEMTSNITVKKVYMSCIFHLSCSCWQDVDSLWSISSTFYASIFCTKLLCAAFFYLHVTREKLPKRLSYKKSVCKTLMKLTPGATMSLQYCLLYM